MRWTALCMLTAGLSAAAFAADPYSIQSDDVLSVTVYGHEDLTRDVVVLRDGRIQYPLVGQLPAAGQTTDALAKAIAKGLASELRDPKVTVAVKLPAMRRVYASGLVAKSGSYDLKPGWRVSHLIAEAGGLAGSIDGRGTSQTTVRPDFARATIIRGNQTIAVDLVAALQNSDPTADVLLEPGDLVQIQANTNLVHVVGQVRSPGDYQVKDHLGVLETVAAAGGVSDRAALTRAQLVRGGTVIPVNLYSLLVEGKTDVNPEVKAGDILVVPANENQIAVLGGVQSPGYFDLPDGKPLTVADALGLAHGPKQRAKTGSVGLIRTVGGRQVVSKVDFARFLKAGDLSQNPTLAAGDVVFVPDSSTVDWGQLTASNALAATSGLLLRALFP